jgi:hypothetical protein
MNPEIYFALRGGGNNFGIVTEFTLIGFRQGPVWHHSEVYSLEDAFDVMNELETETEHPNLEKMVLVAVSFFGRSRFSITRKTVHERHDKDDDEAHLSTEKGRLHSQGIANVSSVAQEMANLNPRGSYREFATLTVKNSMLLNLRITRIYAEESRAIEDVTDVEVSMVLNPLTTETVHLMELRGGNAFGIDAADGPLTST